MAFYANHVKVFACYLCVKIKKVKRKKIGEDEKSVVSLCIYGFLRKEIWISSSTFCRRVCDCTRKVVWEDVGVVLWYVNSNVEWNDVETGFQAVFLCLEWFLGSK